jgi:hypothetical protein
MTLNTNTVATFPKVSGRMNTEINLPIVDCSGILLNSRAKQKPPVTFIIEEIRANKIVLVNEELNPFELFNNNFETLLKVIPLINTGNKKVIVIRIPTNTISL